MPQLVFSSTDRDAAHQRLADLLADGTSTPYECREDPNAAEPFQVWDGAQAPYVRTSEEEAAERALATPVTDPTWLDALADKLAERVAAKAQD